MEGQKTGGEKVGGLQIEVTPLYKSNLRIWFKASVPQPEDILYLDSLQERTTPASNGIKPGDKLRAHPVHPTYSVPYKISDLVTDLPAPDTRLTVQFPAVEILLHTNVLGRLIPQICVPMARPWSEVLTS